MSITETEDHNLESFSSATEEVKDIAGCPPICEAN